MDTTATFYYSDVEHDSLYVQRRVLTVVLLQIATVGVYSLVWFYQNWRQVQKNTDSTIFPSLRALFNVFFAYPLFSGIADVATNMRLGGRYLLRVLGVTHFIGHILLTSRFESFPVLQLISTLIVLLDIAFVQYKINQINRVMYQARVGKFGRLDIALILVIIAEIAFFITTSDT